MSIKKILLIRGTLPKKFIFPTELNLIKKIKIKTNFEFEYFIRYLGQEMKKNYYFFHPVHCSNSFTPHAIKKSEKNERIEVYKCGDTLFEYKRFSDISQFFYHKYGRCGEFAQALYTLLHFLNYKVRLVVGICQEMSWDHAWIEIKHPFSKEWVSCDIFGEMYTTLIPIESINKNVKVYSIDKNKKIVNLTKKYIDNVKFTMKLK